jgi:hypothetical protein
MTAHGQLEQLLPVSTTNRRRIAASSQNLQLPFLQGAGRLRLKEPKRID